MHGWRGFLGRFLDRFITTIPQPADEREAGRGQVSAAPGHPHAIEDATARNLDHLVWMLDDVLEQARSGGQEARAEPVDVRALLAQIAARHDPARLEIVPAPWPLFVLAKPSPLERLFEILLQTALASGTRAAVRLDRGTCAMVAYVDDNGPGVPRHMRELAFSPSASGPGGRGALATAREIARALQGEIAISSSPEGGARLTVRLPLLPDEVLEYAAAS